MTLSIAGLGYVALGIVTLTGAGAEFVDIAVHPPLTLLTAIELVCCGCVGAGGLLFIYLGLLESRQRLR